MRSGKAVLIYDSNCPICSSTAAWIKEHEREHSFEMLPCQSERMKELMRCDSPCDRLVFSRKRYRAKVLNL